MKVGGNLKGLFHRIRSNLNYLLNYIFKIRRRYINPYYYRAGVFGFNKVYNKIWLRENHSEVSYLREF